MRIATDEQILDFIDSFRAEHGYSPSYREICAAVGMKSACSIHSRLERMRRDGLLTYRDRVPRTLRTIRKDEEHLET